MLSKFKKWLTSQPKVVLIIVAIPLAFMLIDVILSLISCADTLGVIAGFILAAVAVHVGINIYKLFNKQ